MRRPTFLILPLFALLTFACARHAKPPVSPPPATRPIPTPLASLTIEVTDFRSNNGQLMICVFDRAAGFPADADRAVLWQIRPIKARDRGFVRFRMSLPPGTYAVTAIHDENSNGKIDRGFMGIPSEGFGATNNPKPKFRAPTFNEAKFELPATGAVMQISVQYY